MRKRQNSTTLAVVDLTESGVANGMEDLSPDDCQIKQESANKNQTPSQQDFNLEKSSSRDPPVFALQRDCGDLKPKQICLDPQMQHQKQTDKAPHCAPTVKLRRLPFLETHVTELKASKCSVYVTKDSKEMSLHLRPPDSNSEAPEYISNVGITTTNGPYMEPSLDESPPNGIESFVRQEQQENSNEFTSTQLNAEIAQHLQSPADSPCSGIGSTVATSKERSSGEDERDDRCSSMVFPDPTSPFSSQDKAQGSLEREVLCSNLEQLELDKADSRHSCFSDHSSPHSANTGLNPSEPSDLDSLSPTGPISHNLMRQVDPTPISEHTVAEHTSEWQSEEVEANEAPNSPDFLCGSISSEPPLSVSKTEDMDDGSGTGTYGGDLGIDSPVSFLWQEGSDGEQVNEESRFDMDFRAASREDRHFVCPVTLRKILSGPTQALVRHIPPVFLLLLSLTHHTCLHARLNV